MIWYDAEKEAQKVIWRRYAPSTREIITKFLVRWKPATELIVNAAFVPAFMSLRILHKFDFLPKIPNLRLFPLHRFPLWKQIEKQISK
jgi:hypothetical protein